MLNNWRRHHEDRARAWSIDPFSSGILFGGWKELEHELFMPRYRETYRPLIVWLPRTWLLSTGLRRHGLIRQAEVLVGRTPPHRAMLRSRRDHEIDERGPFAPGGGVELTTLARVPG